MCCSCRFGSSSSNTATQGAQGHRHHPLVVNGSAGSGGSGSDSDLTIGVVAAADVDSSTKGVSTPRFLLTKSMERTFSGPSLALLFSVRIPVAEKFLSDSAEEAGIQRMRLAS